MASFDKDKSGEGKSWGRNADKNKETTIPDVVDKKLTKPVDEQNKSMDDEKPEMNPNNKDGAHKRVTRFCQILIECRSENLNKKACTHCKRLVWTRRPEFEKSCTTRVNIENLTSEMCPNCDTDNACRGTKRLQIPDNLNVKILGFNSADDVRQSMKAILMDQVPPVDDEVDYCSLQVNYSEDPVIKKSRKDLSGTDREHVEKPSTLNDINPLKMANNINDLDIVNINYLERQCFRPDIFDQVLQSNNEIKHIDDNKLIEVNIVGAKDVTDDFNDPTVLRETFGQPVCGIQMSQERQDCGEPRESRNLIEPMETNDVFPNHIHRHFFHVIPESCSEQSTDNQRKEASENNSGEALSIYPESNGNDTASNESEKQYSDVHIKTKGRKSKKSFRSGSSWRSKKSMFDFYFGKLSNVATTKYRYSESDSD